MTVITEEADVHEADIALMAYDTVSVITPFTGAHVVPQDHCVLIAGCYYITPGACLKLESNSVFMVI